MQFAAAGMVAAALVEATTGGQRPRRQSLGRCLGAGGAAFVYAHLVPAEQWGLRSGAAFAQLPWIASLESSLGGPRPLELASWGALTGLLLRLLRQGWAKR